ncbi:MAG: hypothetical protein WC511_02560 [Candidatus Pacearchaeota archaeon]
MTSKEITEVLRCKYINSRRERYACFPELRIGTGYNLPGEGKGATEQRIDFFVFSLFPCDHYAKIAFEIKVNRGDFLKEMKNPLKRRQALIFSNQFYFAAPVGLIKPEEIPIECGLMEIDVKENGLRKWGVAKVKVPAPWREEHNPNWGFIASITRRVAREEKLQYFGKVPICPNCYKPLEEDKEHWNCLECEISISK